MPNSASSLAARFKALSEAPRLDMLVLLQDQGELCVCDMERVLEISPSRASRHLAVLARAGLVEGERVGMWVHYRLVARPDALAASIFGYLDVHFPTDRRLELRADYARAMAQKGGQSCSLPAPVRA